MAATVANANELLRKVFVECVKAANAGNLLKTKVRVNGNELKVDDLKIALNGNCYLVGFGKAVYDMAMELENALGRHLRRGIVSIPVGYGDDDAAVAARIKNKSGSVVETMTGGANNLPDENSFKAAVEIKRLVERCGKDDLLFALISGGGSTLLSYPMPPLSLEKKRNVIRTLSAAGASIVELNAVRKALSRLKGGKLAVSAFPCPLVAFVLSDIVGDPIHLVASGPTVFTFDDERAHLDASEILAKFGLRDTLEDGDVREALRRDKRERERIVAAGAPYRRYFDEKVRNVMIANNATILNAAREQIESLTNGSTAAVVLTSRVDASVNHVVRLYAHLVETIVSFFATNDVPAPDDDDEEFRRFSFALRETIDDDVCAYAKDVIDGVAENYSLLKSCRVDRKPIAFICGGEPTIEVTGRGMGGRNQELALRMAVELNRLKRSFRDPRFVELVDSVNFASLATDGIDGPTDAAGAVVNARLIDDALKRALNPQTFLRDNDAYTFFSLLTSGDPLIKSGHTGTNLMDVHVIIFDRP